MLEALALVAILGAVIAGAWYWDRADRHQDEFWREWDE